MTGIICLWSGAVVDIPVGWHLCDGTFGTPDLRNRFVVGAGDTYNPDDSGGATTHWHTVTCGSHTHAIVAGLGVGGGPDFAMITSNVPIGGVASSKTHLPPYYALCYIMKI